MEWLSQEAYPVIRPPTPLEAGMLRGRCSGCGKEDTTRKVQIHITQCPEYLALFRSHPDRALDPAAEYVKSQQPEALQDSEDVREAQREAKREAHRELTEFRKTTTLKRWERVTRMTSKSVPVPPGGSLRSPQALEPPTEVASCLEVHHASVSSR